MLSNERYARDANGDPVVIFASDAEIEIADKLRHALEERYLGCSASSPKPVEARKGH